MIKLLKYYDLNEQDKRRKDTYCEKGNDENYNLLYTSCLMANLAWADEQDLELRVNIFYDTDIIVDKEGIEGDITWEDVDKIETILENEIRLLNINSMEGIFRPLITWLI